MVENAIQLILTGGMGQKIPNFLRNMLTPIILNIYAEEWEDFNWGNDCFNDSGDELVDSYNLLGFGDRTPGTISIAEVKTAYKEKSKLYHPDVPGESNEAMIALNNAKDIVISLLATFA